VIATDAKGIITFLNPVAQQLSGWAGNEALGRPLATVFAITNQYTGQTVENPAEVVLREGSVGTLAKDTVLRSKDGRVIPGGDSSAPIRDQQGNVIGVVLVFRDLTAPKLAEEAYLYLASIVESSDDAIIGERPDGAITSWNAAATRIFGYSEQEMIGSNIKVLTPEGRNDDSLEILQRIQRGERVLHYETVRCKKDDSEIAVDLTISRRLRPRRRRFDDRARHLRPQARAGETSACAKDGEPRCARRRRRSRFQ
jgi:PAS domain S-box-containing protein